MESQSLMRSCVVLVVVCVGLSSSEVVHSSCPNPGSQSSFDINQYLGRWYEYERFSAWFEVGVVCGSALYGLRDDGKLSVINGGRREIKLFGHVISTSNTSITGTASIPNPSRPSELTVSFSRFDPGTGPANYFIVETDYTGYTVVFSCTDLPGPFSIQYAWIMTRERGVAPPNLAAIKANLQSAGVDLSHFNSVDQSDCSGY